MLFPGVWMSTNPFAASASVRARIEAMRAEHGSVVGERIESILTARRHATDNSGSVVFAEEAAALIAEFHLESVEELMLLALPSATAIARPPISDFHVGVVGLERDTGNLVFGGNVEFPGTHLGFTIHGEGFVFTRAFSRGTAIVCIALGEAHPCAHCRQYLSEFAATRDLVLIDPLGHRLRMADLLPWPFDPAYLGDEGAVPGRLLSPTLSLARNDLPTNVAERLTELGRKAHAPYSKCPGAAVLATRDGNLIGGASIESVAYNPTIMPIQAALIDLIAHRYSYGDIAAAALGTTLGGAVDYARSTAEALARIAPDAQLQVVGWHV